MLTSFLDDKAPWAIGVFRIVVGLLFFLHGTTSFFNWPGEPYGGNPEFGAWPGWWSALIQLVAGLLVMLGVGTRSAAFIGSGSMAVAYFWKHQPDGLFPIENDGDSAALFCWALVILVFTGPGKPALDSLLTQFTPSVRAGASETAENTDKEAAEVG